MLLGTKEWNKFTFSRRDYTEVIIIFKRGEKIFYDTHGGYAGCFSRYSPKFMQDLQKNIYSAAQTLKSTLGINKETFHPENDPKELEIFFKQLKKTPKDKLLCLDSKDEFDILTTLLSYYQQGSWNLKRRKQFAIFTGKG